MKKGFATLDKIMRGKGRKMASCKSCYYLAPDDEGNDGCTNTNVTKFDFVTEGDGREYCIYWTVEERKDV